MMKQSFAAFAVLLLLAVGCKENRLTVTKDSQSVSTTQHASMTPEDLGKLGAQIKKQPNDARKLLMEHGLTEATFAAAIRKVSENPAEAKRYTTAFKQAS